MISRFTRVKTSEGGAMREESTGAFVLHGDYVKLKARHDEILEALQDLQARACIYVNTSKAEAAIAKATGETK